jgi:DNA-binding MarR family transcriptional regulator
MPRKVKAKKPVRPARPRPRRRARRRVAASARTARVAANPLPIETSPFFKLMLLANLMGRPFGRLYGRKNRINLTEWRVMVTLASMPGSTGNDIAHVTGLDKMSVSRAVHGLMRRGRVVRRAHQRDRRHLLLALSPAGVALFRAIAGSGRQREKDLMAALDAGERREFQALLGKLVARVRLMQEGDGKPADD